MYNLIFFILLFIFLILLTFHKIFKIRSETTPRTQIIDLMHYYKTNGICNNNNVCYANAAIQCLFGTKDIYWTIKSSPNIGPLVAKLLWHYENFNIEETEKTVLELCNKLGFVEKEYESSFEFLYRLFNHQEGGILKECCEFIEQMDVMCFNCNYKNSIEEKLFFLTIKTEGLPKTTSLQVLLDGMYNTDYKEIVDSKCTLCQAKLSAYNRIVCSNRTLILLLNTCDIDSNKNNVILDPNSFITENINFANKDFEFSGAIFYEGYSTENGHFYAILKKSPNSLVLLNDSKIGWNYKWGPNESKNLYMMFFTEKR